MSRIKLYEHFNFGKLLRFVAPSIFMMVFTSIYVVIDGLFVSNFVGKTPFAALNLIFPFIMILGTLGFMIGAGGTAIVSKLLGEGKKDEANAFFSLFVIVTAIGGVVLAVIGEAVTPYIAKWFKATEEMFPYCVLYARILLTTLPFYMLQNVFQSFFTAAEKPGLGFVFTLIAGGVNIVLDGVLVGAFRTGLSGAAIATCISQAVGGILPVVYFSIKNNSLLGFCKPKFSAKVLGKACSNGFSEFVSNVSGSVVSIVFNYRLMDLAGENGVSAYGVLMYVNFVFVAIFIGYAIGTAPLIGFNYGAENRSELKNIFKKSMILMGIIGVCMTGLALALSYPIAKLFVGYDAELTEMTKNAFMISSPAFVFAGFAIFASSMFTAFGNGMISAAISFLRTLVFQIVSVLVLPLIWGLTGVWLSMLAAEVLSTTVAAVFCIVKRKKYGYA